MDTTRLFTQDAGGRIDFFVVSAFKKRPGIVPVSKSLAHSLPAFALGAILALAGANVGAAPLSGGPLYLAMGDSLAAGVGSSDPDTLAYVPLNREHLVVLLDEPNLGLVNLGVSGETSAKLITDGQLASAIALLTERNSDRSQKNDVQVVTINIGGNDAIGLFLYWFGNCAGQGIPRPPQCQFAFNDVLFQFEQNLDIILSDLRTAAGPHTDIVVATNYNPLVQPVGFFFFPQAIQTVNVILEGGENFDLLVVPEDGGLNDITRRVASDHGVLVADVVPGGEFPALLGPKDIVAEEFDCAHANDDGHEIIADTFKDALKDK